jgi:hypothetical protein
MRWLFADPNNAEEGAYVRETVAAIDRWWEAFGAKTAELEEVFQGKSKLDLPKFMEETLQAIHPSLMWEYGPAVRQEKGRRLVITPESQRQLRPMLRTILERAPKIAGWEFYPYRLAETPEQAALAVKSRLDVSVASALIDASVAPGRKIDLSFSFPKHKTLDEEKAMHAAFVATEALLGEQVLDTWIGMIGLAEGTEKRGTGPLPLERAQGTVAALIRSLIDQLPTTRAQDISIGKNWATIKLDPPEEAEEYPGRSDLMIAATNNVELFQAIHSGQPFASSCHSRLGEMFCYLKLDASDIPSNEIVAFRSQFEDALNPALLEANAGGCIGGGSGLRYAYIDMAITDIKRATPIIRKVLAEHQAPARSWILFNDDDLAAEWIGIYSKTPPPPEVESED